MKTETMNKQHVLVLFGVLSVALYGSMAIAYEQNTHPETPSINGAVSGQQPLILSGPAVESAEIGDGNKASISVKASKEQTALPVTANPFPGVNLAFNVGAKMHPFVDPPDPLCVAEHAVDGNTDGKLYTGSLACHSMGSNAFLDVDLGAVKTINGVVIWKRTDAPQVAENLSHAWLLISNTPFDAKGTVQSLKNKKGITAKPLDNNQPFTTVALGKVKGRYVRVQLDNLQVPEPWFNIAEIQVYGN